MIASAGGLLTRWEVRAHSGLGAALTDRALVFLQDRKVLDERQETRRGKNRTTFGLVNFLPKVTV